MTEPTRRERRMEETFIEKCKEFMSAYTSRVYDSPEEARVNFNFLNAQWKGYCTAENHRKVIMRMRVRANPMAFEKYAEELGVRPPNEDNVISINQKNEDTNHDAARVV